MTKAKPNVLWWRREMFGHHIPTLTTSLRFVTIAAPPPCPRHDTPLSFPRRITPSPPPRHHPRSQTHTPAFIKEYSCAFRVLHGRRPTVPASSDSQNNTHARRTRSLTKYASSQAPPRARRNGTTQGPASDACVTPPHTRRRPHSEWLPPRAREASAACSSNTTNRAGHGGN